MASWSGTLVCTFRVSKKSKVIFIFIYIFPFQMLELDKLRLGPMDNA